MKEFLSRNRVPFTERNVDDDPSAYDELLARGWRTVPVTVIGDRVVKGFDPDSLRTAIDARPESAT